MNGQFCSYEISKRLKELRFKDECLGFYSKHDQFHLISYGRVSYNNTHDSICIHPLYKLDCSAPLWQQVIDWLREEHRFHIQITPISYLNYTKIAYFYNIGSDDANKAIYDYQDKYGDVLDASTQEIPGHYLNDDLYDKNIFDMDFAYKTYEECREKAILKALEIIKQV
jgi:hypothetical protein